MVEEGGRHLCAVGLCASVALTACGEAGTGKEDSPGGAEEAPAAAELSLPTAAADLSPWTLPSTPRFELGSGEDGGPVYHRVGQARTLDDGSVLIADRADALLLLYDSTGRFVRTLGGMGYGPGEFRMISGVAPLRGDTILVFDGAGRRLTTMTLGGNATGTHTVELPADFEHSLSGYELAGVLEGDRAVLVPDAVPGRPRTEADTFRIEIPVLVVSRDGELLHRLDGLWGMEAFGDELTTMIAPLGWRRIARVTEEGILSADVEAGVIQRYDARGTPAQTLHLSHDREPLPAHVQDDWIESRTRAIEDRAQRAQFQLWLAQVPFPEHLPYLSDLHADGGGRFWVRTATLPNEASESQWIIVDAEGVPTAAIKLPSALRILELRGPRLLGLWTDSLGVQTVRSYDLDRREAPAT